MLYKPSPFLFYSKCGVVVILVNLNAPWQVIHSQHIILQIQLHLFHIFSHSHEYIEEPQYLSYPMGSIHGLQVSHGVPVMFHKHHRVCTRQVQTQTSHVGGQQQHVNGGVVVKSEILREIPNLDGSSN